MILLILIVYFESLIISIYIKVMYKILVFGGVIFGLFFKIASDLDYFKPVTSYNEYGNCKYLKEDIRGPEDMTQYNSTTIIIGSGNFQKVFARGKPELEQ